MRVHFLVKVSAITKLHTMVCGIEVDHRVPSDERLITTYPHQVTCPMCLYKMGRIDKSELKRITIQMGDDEESLPPLQ